MTTRRQFIQTISLVAASGGAVAKSSVSPFGALKTDRSRILDLPDKFEYRVIARAGHEMSDGFLAPGEADGMAAFSGDNGRVILVCNHENEIPYQELGPFGHDLSRLDKLDPRKVYDYGAGKTPGNGGTTNIIYDPVTGQSERQFLSLVGTELNCAGGATPWNSWLSCEESFGQPGSAIEYGKSVWRDQDHGYIFEVPASAKGLVDPRPIREMGRFLHEAAAVNPHSGAVYLTEDMNRSLVYRFLPSVPGDLHAGGRLQALAVDGRRSFDTRNWKFGRAMKEGEWSATRWIDLTDVDTPEDDLRLRGFEAGAARFARGEGLCFAQGSAFITCTTGGSRRLGQIFEYRASPHEGTDEESEAPGQLRLLAEADKTSILRHADNITMSPWGDLIVCEDTADHCGLIGIRPDGSHYLLADNAYTDSELAGACFSPDGRTMFLNIQHNGLTLAINGPW